MLLKGCTQRGVGSYQYQFQAFISPPLEYLFYAKARANINRNAITRGSIPFLQKYLAIGNRGYKTEVRLRGLS